MSLITWLRVDEPHTLAGAVEGHQRVRSQPLGSCLGVDFFVEAWLVPLKTPPWRAGDFVTVQQGIGRVMVSDRLGFKVTIQLNSSADTQPVCAIYSPETVIPFGLPQAEHVVMEVFNLMGRRVAMLLDEPMAAGRHEVVWQTTNLPSGIYLVRLRAGLVQKIQRVTLLK